MYSKIFSSFIYVAALCTFTNAAVVSLYVPGTDPDVPLTADKLGVDDQGRTSWRIAAGVASGTLTNSGATRTADPFAQFTATLVEGPNDAHIVGNLTDFGLLSDDCTIKDGIAVCTGVLSASGTQSTAGIVTETARFVEVQTSNSGGLKAGAMLSASAVIVMGAFAGMLL